MQEPDICYLYAGFFQQFTSDRVVWLFSCVYESTWQPPTGVWPKYMVKDEHFALAIDHHGGGRHCEGCLGAAQDKPASPWWKREPNAAKKSIRHFVS